MNLKPLFDMQHILDQRIMDKHPELKGQDNIEWKVLALQVELGECANEWRAFKKWSNDQKPRTEKMLEEYVDCLHFVLSLGIEKGFVQSYSIYTMKTITASFIYLNKVLSDFYNNPSHGNYGRIIMVFLGLGKLLGFTWDEIEQAYFKKNEVNHKRQDSGY